MNNYGFVKITAASPSLRVADCEYNTENILKILNEAEAQGVDAVVFPEMCITSYTAGDLFNQRILLDEAINSLARIRKETEALQTIAVVGMPLDVNNKLYNVGIVVARGEIWGIVPKTFLPAYNEFYDKRWFSSPRELKQNQVEILNQIVPIGTNIIFDTSKFKFAIEICEDLWTPIPPSSFHCLFGADVIFNLSASPETIGKHTYRQTLVSQQSARCISGYVYASSSNGESTTDLVFAGSSLIAENGEILARGNRFSFENESCVADIDIDKLRNDRLRNKSYSTSEYQLLDNLEYRTVKIDSRSVEHPFKLDRFINPTPFVPNMNHIDETCSEIFAIQIGGLAKRLIHTGVKTAVVGISGGLDSTLALLVVARAFDKLNIPRKNIYGITMPGFGTTNRTYNNALSLMSALGVTIKEISIRDAVLQHFKDIDHDPSLLDVTYENSQARERTQILMDYSNKINGLVIGTGDLSELALGWCTYNGDHMSMYAVNTSIPKTLVKVLVKWVAESQVDIESRKILIDILDTPISPELLPANDEGEINQITEDNVGPYLLHDFFLFNMLRFGFEPQKILYLAKQAFIDQFDEKEILKWLKVFYKRFFTQQFKRSCIPDGPKVGSVNLSPRGDWRMPSDTSMSLWMKQLEPMK